MFNKAEEKNLIQLWDFLLLLLDAGVFRKKIED